MPLPKCCQDGSGGKIPPPLILLLLTDRSLNWRVMHQSLHPIGMKVSDFSGLCVGKFQMAQALPLSNLHFMPTMLNINFLATILPNWQQCWERFTINVRKFSLNFAQESFAINPSVQESRFQQEEFWTLNSFGQINPRSILPCMLSKVKTHKLSAWNHHFTWVAVVSFPRWCLSLFPSEMDHCAECVACVSPFDCGSMGEQNFPNIMQLLCRASCKHWNCKLKNTSFSARPPSKMKLASWKTKLFCHASPKKNARAPKRSFFFARLP